MSWVLLLTRHQARLFKTTHKGWLLKGKWSKQDYDGGLAQPALEDIQPKAVDIVLLDARELIQVAPVPLMPRWRHAALHKAIRYRYQSDWPYLYSRIDGEYGLLCGLADLDDYRHWFSLCEEQNIAIRGLCSAALIYEPWVNRYCEQSQVLLVVQCEGGVQFLFYRQARLFFSRYRSQGERPLPLREEVDQTRSFLVGCSWFDREQALAVELVGFSEAVMESSQQSCERYWPEFDRESVLLSAWHLDGQPLNHYANKTDTRLYRNVMKRRYLNVSLFIGVLCAVSLQVYYHQQTAVLSTQSQHVNARLQRMQSTATPEVYEPSPVLMQRVVRAKMQLLEHFRQSPVDLIHQLATLLETLPQWQTLSLAWTLDKTVDATSARPFRAQLHISPASSWSPFQSQQQLMQLVEQLQALPGDLEVDVQASPWRVLDDATDQQAFVIELYGVLEGEL